MSLDCRIGYKYDYDNNILEVKNSNVCDYYLKLRGPIMTVTGESSTGKTLLVNTLRMIIKSSSLEQVCTNNVIVATEKDELMKLVDKRQLIVLDRCNQWIDEESERFIKSLKESKLLLMMRNPVKFGLTPNYFGQFVVNDGRIEMMYKFSERLWFR